MLDIVPNMTILSKIDVFCVCCMSLFALLFELWKDSFKLAQNFTSKPTIFAWLEQIGYRASSMMERSSVTNSLISSIKCSVKVLSMAFIHSPITIFKGHTALKRIASVPLSIPSTYTVSPSPPNVIELKFGNKVEAAIRKKDFMSVL